MECDDHAAEGLSRRACGLLDASLEIDLRPVQAQKLGKLFYILKPTTHVFD